MILGAVLYCVNVFGLLVNSERYIALHTMGMVVGVLLMGQEIIK